MEEIKELGGATSRGSLVTYKPYGVSHFSQKQEVVSSLSGAFVGWFVRFRVHFVFDVVHCCNQTLLGLVACSNLSLC